MSEYINEFERKYNKSKSHGSLMSPDILAYHLLNSANISDEHKKLARATTTNLTFDDMKNKLKRIFGTEERSSVGFPEEKCKFEDVNSVEGEEDVLYGRRYGANRYPTNYQKYQSNSNKTFSNNGTDIKGNSLNRTKAGKNLLDSKGNRTKCLICESIYHYANKCPEKVYHAEEEVLKTEEYHNVVLYQSNLITKEEFRVLVAESTVSAILDSGASATVAGRVWVENYIQGLSEDDLQKVEYEDSKGVFKFGSGNKFSSLYKVKLPAKIGNKKVFILSDVVETDIPLLLSKAAMKRAETKISFTDDSVTMFGLKQEVFITSSGHYSIPLNSNGKILKDISAGKNVHITLFTKNMDKHKIALKLHAQFAHPTKDKLIELVKRAGYAEDDELIKNIVKVSDSCEICKQYKRPSPIPVVGLPMASKFNELVAMDLKFFQGKIILHIIDHLTRFSVAVILKSKEPKEIISAIMKSWISIFGPPSKFLTDNGGEFAKFGNGRDHEYTSPKYGCVFAME